MHNGGVCGEDFSFHALDSRSHTAIPSVAIDTCVRIFSSTYTMARKTGSYYDTSYCNIVRIWTHGGAVALYTEIH